ncbi:hypothetical protein AKG34_00700 [Peribacillus butanolivorans]|jgi:hypothetical protein|nr:hypothetical protein AKG34_00700 [Peribacillus butanolivorans]KQU23242.1 hypothetical protein ASG65_02630 [Bacillus sp. Leaf13]KRF62004.1 hypothetical protein ASG99_06270 [Bacillus sp. Soil768D1]
MTLSTKKKEEFNSLCVAFLQKIQAFKPKKTQPYFIFLNKLCHYIKGIKQKIYYIDKIHNIGTFK